MVAKDHTIWRLHSNLLQPCGQHLVSSQGTLQHAPGCAYAARMARITRAAPHALDTRQEVVYMAGPVMGTGIRADGLDSSY